MRQSLRTVIQPYVLYQKLRELDLIYVHPGKIDGILRSSRDYLSSNTLLRVVRGCIIVELSLIG